MSRTKIQNDSFFEVESPPLIDGDSILVYFKVEQDGNEIRGYCHKDLVPIGVLNKLGLTISKDGVISETNEQEKPPKWKQQGNFPWSRPIVQDKW